MNESIVARAPLAISRRAFVSNLALAGAAFAMAPLGFRSVSVGDGQVVRRITRAPIVSFYMDRLYLDLTGTAIPYVSPRGMRSGAPLAQLSEEAFRNAQCYV